MSSSSCLPFSTSVPSWVRRVFTSLDSTLFRDRTPSNFLLSSSSSAWSVFRSLASFYGVRKLGCGSKGTLAISGLAPTYGRGPGGEC